MFTFNGYQFSKESIEEHLYSLSYDELVQLTKQKKEPLIAEMAQDIIDERELIDQGIEEFNKDMKTLYAIEMKDIATDNRINNGDIELSDLYDTRE